MQCSAEKPWVLAFRWMFFDMYHTKYFPPRLLRYLKAPLAGQCSQPHQRKNFQDLLNKDSWTCHSKWHPLMLHLTTHTTQMSHMKTIGNNKPQQCLMLGFPFDNCIVRRWSMLFAPAVCGFGVLASQCLYIKSKGFRSPCPCPMNVCACFLTVLFSWRRMIWFSPSWTNWKQRTETSTQTTHRPSAESTQLFVDRGETGRRLTSSPTAFSQKVCILCHFLKSSYPVF